MSPVYVYAIADRGARVEGTGLAGEALAVLAGARVSAVVGTVAAAPAVDEASLRAHDETVRRVAAQVPALLPARFGSVAAGTDDVRQAIDAGGEAHLAALELVRGREQMTLRVLDPPGGPATTAVSAAGGGPGARYLAARAIETGAAGVPGLREFLEALAPHVAAETVERHQTPPLRASVYHLIPRGSSAAYLDAVRAIGARSPALKVAASGPWPPYAFAAGLR